MQPADPVFETGYVNLCEDMIMVRQYGPGEDSRVVEFTRAREK